LGYASTLQKPPIYRHAFTTFYKSLIKSAFSKNSKLVKPINTQQFFNAMCVSLVE